MDGFPTSSPIPVVDKFSLGKKWFWIGMVAALFNVVAGLIFGIALVVEKDHRKEGLIIIIWAVVWALISFFFVGPWLAQSGLLPKFQIIK